MGAKQPRESKPPKQKTPTFLLELPLVVEPGQARRLRGHLEAGRQLYNAILSEGNQRLRQMRADPAWQAARAIPRTHKQERASAFLAQRKVHGFSEVALYEAVKGLRVGWIADHIEAVVAQTLATRAYRALNRVCLGQARRVRFKSRGASRTSGMRRGCALSCRNRKQGTKGISFGTRIICPPSSTGKTRWSNMA